MKIIEALKRIKSNRDKVYDLINKVRENSARLSSQTSPYGDEAAAKAQVQSWIDTVKSVLRENEVLANRVHRTNVATQVTIELGGKQVTKSIDEWLTRRKDGVDLEQMLWQSVGDRGLKETLATKPDGTTEHIVVVRHYDVRMRDENLSVMLTEKSEIDSALEIVNATTDLLE